MRVLTFFLLLQLVAPANLSGQLQYTAVPRTGDGRFDRSVETEFWVNPIFLKPSVFFSSNQTSLRANRKWWRNSGRFLPVPDSSLSSPYSAVIPQSNQPSPFTFESPTSLFQLKWETAPYQLPARRSDKTPPEE